MCRRAFRRGTFDSVIVRLFFLRGGVLSFRYGLTQEILNLAIHTAQLVSGPFFQLLPEIGRKPEEKRFAGGAGHSGESVVQRAGIHHRRDLAFAAENDEQIAHHCGFAFFIHGHDFFCGKFL